MYASKQVTIRHPIFSRSSKNYLTPLSYITIRCQFQEKYIVYCYCMLLKYVHVFYGFLFLCEIMPTKNVRCNKLSLFIRNIRNAHLHIIPVL